MANPKFKSGDQVQLISGGPATTVNSVTEVRNGNQLNLVWYQKGKMETITLFEGAVKSYKADDPSAGFFVG